MAAGKHANRIVSQESSHKASKEQKIGGVRDRKQAKIASEYHLPAFRVEVAEPVVAHINSTSYSRRSNEHRKHKRCILLLWQKKRHVDEIGRASCRERVFRAV